MPKYTQWDVQLAAWLCQVDWQLRHSTYMRLKRQRPVVAAKIRQQLSPDELLEGENTGITAMGAVIPLFDAKRWKQLKLTDFFKKKPKAQTPKPFSRQLKITSFFK